MQIRPLFVPLDPVDRVEYDPGDVAQCDLWFPPVPVPVTAGQERVLPVLVMTWAFSRFMAATMIPSRQAGDILAGMWTLISGVGRVPKTLVWDREAAIGGTGRVSLPAAAFAGTLATQIRLAPPHDPESKGMVERRNGFFETSFLPGRTFVSPFDFNTQIEAWLTGTANARHLRSIGAARSTGARGRLRRDDTAATDAARGRADPADPVGPGLLRPGRHQRLLRRPAGDRPVRRRRHPGPVPRSATGRSWPATTGCWAKRGHDHRPDHRAPPGDAHRFSQPRQPRATRRHTLTGTSWRCARCPTTTPCSASPSTPATGAR